MTKDPSQAEIELKFAIPPAQLDALADALHRGKFRVQRLQAIYYDTADDWLAAQGLSIRLRKEGRRWVQTVKGLTTSSLRRLEHNVPRGLSSPELDLTLHDGTAAGAALHAAISGPAKRNHEPVLIERFRIEIVRTARTERIGEANANAKANVDPEWDAGELMGACVEVALDIGTIRAGARSTAICEFEMELKSGTVADLIALAQTWVARHGLWLSTVSKAQRGARLLGERSVEHPVHAVTPVIDESAGRAGFLAATLESCLVQILSNASEVGAGALDAQFVHQLRVGLRRTRTALRELRGFAAGIDPSWETTFARVFRALGAHRDIEIVIPAILKEMSAAGLECAFEPAHAHDIASTQDVVRAPDFQSSLLAVLAFCHAPPKLIQSEKGAAKQLRRKVAQRLARLHARLARDAKVFSKLSPARQHSVRKRLKRLRYLSEFAAPLFDAERVHRSLQSWREAQDALGQCNDYRVGLAALRLDAQNGRCAKPGLRWLATRIEISVKRCARALRDAAKRAVFWADIDE